MKVPAQVKIESVVSTDKHRRPLSEAYLDTTGDTPVLVATDGFAMVTLPVEAAKEEQGWVSPAALKAARKLAKKAEMLEITCNGSLALSDGTQFPRSTEQSTGFYPYPQWRMVLPAPDRPVVFRVALNVEFLKRVADGLGDDEVILEFNEVTQPILVTPCKKPLRDGRKGVLMPIKVKE